MGEPSDEPSLSDRFRSWAKRSATNGRASTKQAPILPQTEKKDPQDARRHGSEVPTERGTRTRQASNGNSIAASNGGGGDVQSDSTPSASLPTAPPLQDTETQGEKPASINQDGRTEKPNIPTRLKNGIIRFGMHTKNSLTRSWFNLLLLFVPVGIAVNFAKLNPEIIFAMNAIAIVPLAGLLTYATETVAKKLGDTWGALLNVSFGNAVELIILYVYLKSFYQSDSNLPQYVRDITAPRVKPFHKTCHTLKANSSSLYGCTRENIEQTSLT